ncbi:hypothetical protein WJX81_002523 [Elliptochloris bilobata]|uniref:Cytochrome b-c1 complex subunit 8 n=1 Tax=Elliptochloris bilobata TaxID=381761 RepID=A0AAW1QVK5_9CHLO
MDFLALAKFNTNIQLAHSERGEEAPRMGKLPVRLKEVVYTVSPFEVSVLSGLWKDLPQKLHRKWSENWVDIGFFAILPVYATMWYANDYKEKEKMHHRY